MRIGPLNRRWLVPVVAAGAIFLTAAVPNIIPSAGASTPDLPPLSTAQLLEKVHHADGGPYSGDVRLVSDLGLPDLGGLSGGASSTLTDLAAGEHDAHVWFGGPDRVKISLPSSLAETDWIRNGADLWSWDSRTQEARHATVPAHVAHGEPAPDVTQETPGTFAQRLLDDITPSTEVTVRSPRYVAGRPVYELALAPRTDASTVGEAVVSIDAATGTPLDVRVVPRGRTSPAFEFGFTSIGFGAQPASEFAFTPPHGATVTNVGNAAEMVLGDRHDGPRRFRRPPQGAPTLPARSPASVQRIGTGWTTVVVISGGMAGRYQELLSGATRVNGGRLVTTRLVNLLVLDDGRIAIGAVTPSTLEAAVSS